MPEPTLHPAILSPASRVVFFPVRHHSPAGARLVRELALAMRPATILIEGPADFNGRLHELALPHRLPIAIYSYVRLPDGRRAGAFYPFCIYSPEWQALAAARELGAATRFIDLPWAAIADDEPAGHRYADSQLRSGDYPALLCQRLGVETFDDAWDALCEVDASLDVAGYLTRVHTLCFHIRITDNPPTAANRQREAYMAGQIRQALGEHEGRILVVTGGYHSYALFARVHDIPFEESEPDLPPAPVEGECGSALTPYSYPRLDSLAGYEAGMPNPGFYHQVWHDRLAGRQGSYRQLLAQTAEALRRRKQAVSAADLIAVEATAQGLAALRGHSEVWRRDLVDGITGALVKDEIAYGQTHPFLAAVYQALRGDERGYLAAGAELPPLVHDIQASLHEHDLEPATAERQFDLDLFAALDLARSRVLHRLRILAIPGFQHIGGTDLAAGGDTAEIREQWRISWSPDLDAACIEAAVYGPTLAEAAAARLLEQAGLAERDAGQAARILLDAALAGLADPGERFYRQLVGLIRQDGDFLGVTAALGLLLYLYRYDQALGTAGRADLEALVGEAFARGLWLLESLGHPQGRDRELLAGVAALVHTAQRCAGLAVIDQAGLVETLKRISTNVRQAPLLRGAATGAIWTLGEAPLEQLVAGVRYYAAPGSLGDYLTGLFHLAREAVQRRAELLLCIDELIMAYDDEELLEALPALRLAFSYFTPREKHHLARTLLAACGQVAAAPLPALEAGPEVAERALAWEGRLLRALARYGVRAPDGDMNH